MRKPLLAITWIFVATVCGARPSVAQPAPPPEASQPAPPAPIAPPPAEATPPPPSTFGAPSQIEVTPAEPPRPAPRSGRRLSPGMALGLSLGGTAVSWTLLLAGDGGPQVAGLLGMFLAPNLGHWYQGTIVTRGIGLRVLGLATATYALFRMEYCENGCDSHEYILFGSALLFVGATIDDIITAPLRARARNRERDLELGLAPVVTPRSAGLALSGRF